LAEGTASAVSEPEDWKKMLFKVAFALGIICALFFIPSVIATITLLIKAVRVSNGRSRRSILLNR
jgi:hypothetical protein